MSGGNAPVGAVVGGADAPEAGTPVPVVAPEGTKESDEQTLERLVKLTPMEYDRVRKEAASVLGVQVKTLDGIVADTRQRAAEKPSGLFPEIEPHADPVDPAQLFNEIAGTIKRFIILDEQQADAITLWIALTYLVDAVDICPILIVDAPERACAKTLLQNLVASLSHRPLAAANASTSAIFRAVEDHSVSLFIDEADTFFKKNPELHGLVNAGYKRGGGVLRSEPKGDSFEPRLFSVYGPKSLAGIALERHLPDSTMSRGLVVNMRRKLSGETVERMRHVEPELFALLASKLVRFANDYCGQVRLARPALPDEMSDRSQDNWEPLLAIAACAGPVWEKRALEAALKLSESSESSAGTGNELLADIQYIFEKRGLTKIRTADLIAGLIADEDLAWATYNRGKPLSPRQLAKQLNVYGISPKTVRHGKETPKGYDLEQFRDAFARYLPSPEKLPQHRNAETAPELGTQPNATVPTQQSGEVPDIAETVASKANSGEMGCHWLEVGLDATALDRGGVADTNGGLVNLGTEKDSQFDF